MECDFKAPKSFFSIALLLSGGYVEVYRIGRKLAGKTKGCDEVVPKILNPLGLKPNHDLLVTTN